MGTDPVVGWLVCIHQKVDTAPDGRGPDFGKSFEIRSERNFIGRDASNQIVLPGDPTVHRDKHASVTFDPRSVVFKLHQGEGRGLVRITYPDTQTTELADVPKELKAYDVIELGQTKLIFMPLCKRGMFVWVPGD